MLTIHCGEELVRTSSLRDEVDGVGTTSIAPGTIAPSCDLGLSSAFTCKSPDGYLSPFEVMVSALTEYISFTLARLRRELDESESITWPKYVELINKRSSV